MGQLVEGLSADGARAVLAIDDDRWHGPILSPQGAHFVRIANRHPESRASFEEVASFLQSDWLMARQQVLMQERVKIFAESYQVIIESGDDEPK